MRINHEEQMKLAYQEAEKSVATRLKVGAVIYDHGLSYNMGYNHMPVGYPDSCDHTLFTEEGTVIGSESYPNVIHAELDCILQAARHGLSLNDTIMYITDSPCLRCAELIKAVGIKVVIYDREYSITDGLDYLRNNGVLVYQLKQAPKDL